MTQPARPLSVVPDPVDTSIEDDVRTLVGLQDAIGRLTAHADQIKTRLRTELAPGSHDLAGVKVSISVQRRFDPKLAATRLTAEQIQAITETSTVLSGALAKRVLPPVVYEDLLAEAGEPRVTVR